MSIANTEKAGYIRHCSSTSIYNQYEIIQQLKLMKPQL